MKTIWTALAAIGAGLGLTAGIAYDAGHVGLSVACGILGGLPFVAIVFTWIEAVSHTEEDS